MEPYFATLLHFGTTAVKLTLVTLSLPEVAVVTGGAALAYVGGSCLLKSIVLLVV
ncbi:hypothetical protein RhiirA4_473116 [Rhizophagus irregularis]|uniref:Uncharacterized protein n=1 Tax=Rhizophagus irregularis TaxID=588596 RepID=A0A2I1H648_9GLOM|nr:hypothetical protein RhiirA4_473116 [Rhizophagus irregularis]